MTPADICEVDEVAPVTPEKPAVNTLLQLFQLLIVINRCSAVFVVSDPLDQES